MTLPVSLRINALFPFPATVQGGGPITITKANGIWTVGLDIIDLGTIVPPQQSLATDYVIVYDANVKTFAKMALASFANIVPLPVSHQRSVTAGPVTVQTTDQILNLNLSAPTTITLPSAASRVGAALTFKDVGAQAGTNNITITAGGGDTIDGRASVVLNTNHQSITLVPFNDGINTGWFIV